MSEKFPIILAKDLPTADVNRMGMATFNQMNKPPRCPAVRQPDKFVIASHMVQTAVYENPDTNKRTVYGMFVIGCEGNTKACTGCLLEDKSQQFATFHQFTVKLPSR